MFAGCARDALNAVMDEGPTNRDTDHHDRGHNHTHLALEANHSR